MAETKAHSEAPGGHGGFPPFQKETFVSQLVWLTIAFVLLRIGATAQPRIRLVVDDEIPTLVSRLAGALFFVEEQAEELDRAADPERCYIEHQLHLKLAQDLAYLEHRSLRVDLGIVVDTTRLVVRALTGRDRRGR